MELGERAYELTHRSLVMGILNRTPDSFFDAGAFFAMDRFIDLAAQHVAAGADILDVGGVKAGPGPEVSETEELERVVPGVEALTERFDLPVSVDTWRASVAAAAFKAGAAMGNDISGFADPDYLEVAARAEAAVVATHIRIAPRVADPDPTYDDVTRVVRDRLADLAERAITAGVPRRRIVIDAGLDLGKTWQQSLVLLQRSADLAALGFPLLLSASNKTFLGRALDLEVGERRLASAAATAIGVAEGCRIVRAHDVAGTRRVVDTIAAILAGAAMGE